ncbi:MAG: AAA family ATPase [Kiritimatiellae bacterium]|nr:AAA family ATPase [Kiritimatiellia bacterium]
MLDKVQAYLGTWLEDHLKQIYPADWWDKCVMSVLVPEQCERALDDGATTPADLDLGMLITVFRGNWTLLRRRFHLNPQLYDDAATVKRIRNQYCHRKSSKDYGERFEHDLKTVKLFLKGLGAPETLLNENRSAQNGSHENNNPYKPRDIYNQENVIMSYRDRINGINPISFKAIIDAARLVLPTSIRKAPWIGLEHGVVPLDTEQKLDQYLAAYGKMHVEKIRSCFGALETPDDDLRAPVVVVDWGCGQALATCCLFDWLREENNVGMGRISRVHLIEPSPMALNRATINVEAYRRQYDANFEAAGITKFVNDVQQEDFRIDGAKTTVHLFSNILDIESVNLDFLANFIKHNFTGRQIFFCVGPLNQGASRILEFATKCGIPEQNIMSRCQGRLAQQHGTISMLTFIIDENVAATKKIEFTSTPPADIQDNIALQRVINRYSPGQDVLDRIIQFYQMSTELEQVKEPDVKKATSFPFAENNGCLTVSFSNNQDFINQWNDNIASRWPKDLHFGFDLIWGMKVYRLLYFIKPADELRGKNLAQDSIELKLSDFSVSLGCAESLELTDESIAIIERYLRSANVTWAGLGLLLGQVIGNGATLSTTQINVSLCDKNIALAQIYSELKKMNSAEVQRSPLLKAFLENTEFDNAVDSVSPEELISVVPMDESQRLAICNALNSRMSVVVGPPGCGKTQLILNLLANSIVRDKKVLVASKNNKAVDNVKDRFAAFDPNGCFLRFGTKDYIRDTTCPQIRRLLNLSQQQGYDDHHYAAAIAQLKNLHDELMQQTELMQERLICEEDKFSAESKIKGLREGISEIDAQLEKVLPEFCEKGRLVLNEQLSGCQTVLEKIGQEIEQESQVIEEFPEKENAELSELATQSGKSAEMEPEVTSDSIYLALKELRKTRTDIECRTRGFSGWLVKLFGRDRLSRLVLDAVVGFDESISSYIRKIDGRDSVACFRDCKEVVEFCSKLEDALSAVLEYRKRIDVVRARIKSELDHAQQQVAKKTRRYNDLIEKVKGIKRCLTDEGPLLQTVRKYYGVEIACRERELNNSKVEAEQSLNEEVRKRDLASSRINEITQRIRNLQSLKETVTAIDFGRNIVRLTLDHYLHANDSARAITKYNFYLPDNIPWQHAEMSAFFHAAERFLDVLRLESVTSLSIRSAFPRKEELFDLLVIDEASQCDVASALPLLLRAKQVVVIGDPMQLRHISKIEPEEELAIKRHLNLSGAVHLKYADESLWDYARNWLPWCENSRPCMLQKHYRCHPDIIGYSNEMFYGRQEFGVVDVCTANRPIPPGLPPNGIVWKDISGTQVNASVNVNPQEVVEAVKIAVDYATRHGNLTVGIVTPFADQAKRIDSTIPAQLRGRITADTVHRFQGDEKDVMVYSLVVTNNSPDSKIKWIDCKVPNLVNVAVTRARRLLIIVGNKTYIRNHSSSNLPLGHLVAYVDKINAQGGNGNGNR